MPRRKQNPPPSREYLRGYAKGVDAGVRSAWRAILSNQRLQRLRVIKAKLGVCEVDLLAAADGHVLTDLGFVVPESTRCDLYPKDSGAA